MYVEVLQDNVNIKGYLEYDYNIGKYYNQYNYSKPILGDIDSYIPQEGDYFVLGVADVPFRKKIISTMKKKDAKFYTLIHPTAIIAKDAIIGEGCMIAPFCMLGPKSKIGCYNHLSSYSFISHDCVVGNNNTFSTAGLCGHVSVGNDNVFYIRSTVIPNINIGNGCTIQSGMVVDRNVPDETTVFYRFKEKLLAIPKSEK